MFTRIFDFFLVSCATLWAFGNIQHLVSLHYPDLGVLLQALALTWRTALTLLGPLCNAFVVTGGVNPENTANIVAVSRHGEFAESISPFIQESADCLTNFVLAVL